MAVMSAARVQPLEAEERVDCEIAIVGAGPYGLAAAIHLRSAGMDVRVYGDCMSFWRSMPRGMLLRSNWSASNIAAPSGAHSLLAYQADSGARFNQPVPLEHFIDYGKWIQSRAVPDLDQRRVARVRRDGDCFALELDDGEVVRAERVVVACGIAPFARRPPEFDHLPPELASHTGEHVDLARFAGRHVAVVGGGQSALESASLMHAEGARVEVFARRDRIVWLRGTGVKKRLGRLGPVVYAPTDVGPLWYSRLNATPDLFRRLPRRAQTRIARRSIRPAGSAWVRARLADVPLHLGAEIVSATAEGGRVALELAGGQRRTFDHVLLGTGYRVDVARYDFLDDAVLASVERIDGYPVLGPGLESSVPGLHFLGAPAAWSYGPIMRFVSGSWYAARTLTRVIAGQSAAAGARE